MAKKKEEIKIRPFWYSDIWIFPKMITIITSMDKEGNINAAPYSHIMQYDVMQKNPRMLIGFRQESHSFENICATGEFVVNCPSADHLDDMMETARFWPEGVNELEHTGLTMIPSRKVKPPSIEECPQIAECTVDQIIRLDKSSGIIIANIEAIVMDEGLEQMDRSERIPAMNLPVGLGDQNRRYYYHAHTDNVTMHELADILVREDVIDVLVARYVVDLPEVDHIGLQVLQRTFQVDHGPVVAAVVGLGGQEHLAAAGLHHLAHMPFAGSSQVVSCAAGPILAVPGRSINVIDAHVDALIDNGKGLLLHAHLLHGGLGPPGCRCPPLSPVAPNGL